MRDFFHTSGWTSAPVRGTIAKIIFPAAHGAVFLHRKLDAISNNTTEIKNEVTEMRKELNSHDSRIIKVEESVKSAHHRIDGIETRLNDDKEV